MTEQGEATDNVNVFDMLQGDGFIPQNERRRLCDWQVILVSPRLNFHRDLSRVSVFHQRSFPLEMEEQGQISPETDIYLRY